MIKTDTLQVKVLVDTQDGINNLGYLEEEYRKLGEARKQAAPNSEESKRINQRYDETRQKIAEQRKELGFYGQTAKQIQSYIKDLSLDLRDMIPGSAKAKEFRAEMEKLRQIQRGNGDESKRRSDEIDSLRWIIKDSGTAALSIKQLEDVAKHMHDTMIAGSKSGAIQEHALYNEYVNITRAIKQSRDAVSQAKIAQESYEKELKQTVQTQGIQALSLEHLREYYKLLRREVDSTSDHESEANKKRIAEYRATKAIIDKREQDVTGTTSFFSQLKNGLPSAIAGAVGGLTVGATQYIIDGITNGFRNATRRAAELSDQTAAMQKSLEASEPEVKGIVSELNKLNTRTSSKELKEIAIAAGQMGIAKDEVVAFTGAMDKLNVALGDEFKGGGEEITKTIVPLRNIFQDIKSKNYANDILRIGNAVNVLGASGLATGPVVTDIANRIGSSAGVYGATAGQTLGLAAAYQELGIQTERGSTATVKILQKIASAPKEFAKVAGMATQDFTNLVNTDIMGAFLKVSEGFAKSKGKATEFAEKLSDANVSAAAISEVFAKVGSNTDLVTEKMNLSSQAIKGVSSITQEFNIKNQNFAANLEKAGKVWDRWMNSISSGLSNITAPMINFMAEFGNESKSISEAYVEQTNKVNELQTSINPLINRYRDLTTKQNLSKIEQQELNNLVRDVGKIIPMAITQWDNYGRALKLNLGVLDDYMNAEKNKQLNLKFKNINALVAQNNKIWAERYELGQKIKKGEITDFVEDAEGRRVARTRKIYAEEIVNFQKRIEAIEALNKKNKQKIKDYNTEVDINTPIVETPTNNTGGSNLTDAEKAKLERKQIAEAKFLQESARKEIELQAQLAFEKDQALASDENKKVQQAERNAEKRLNEIRTQFKDENGLVIKESELSIEQKKIITSEEKSIEKTLQNEVLTIRDEYTKKRAAQILDQTNQAIVLAQESHKAELEEQLRLAEKSKDTLRIFNAKQDLISYNESADLSKLKLKFENEKIVLKDNQEAIKLLEKNYEAEKTAITNKGERERANLKEDTSEADKERLKKAQNEKLQLDVQQAQQKGIGVLEAEKALLNAQMQQELDVKGITEEEKTNIARKYALQRAALEKNSYSQISQEAIQVFSQAFGQITSLLRQSLQNREDAENESYNQKVQKLTDAENSGVITKAKADAEKAKLEKKHNRELSIIKRDQAKIDKANNITQATINGLQAVLKGYATLGPIGGAIAQGVMSALTLASIAQIAATPLPKIEGSYFDGGALPDVFNNPVDNKGGGLIIGHPGEYMIPAWIRQQPVFADIEPTIEYMRKTGRSFDVGGPIGSSPQNPKFQQMLPITNAKMEELLTKNIAVQEMLIDRLQRIEVVVGYEAAEKILDTANQMKSIRDSAKAN